MNKRLVATTILVMTAITSGVLYYYLNIEAKNSTDNLDSSLSQSTPNSDTDIKDSDNDREVATENQSHTNDTKIIKPSGTPSDSSQKPEIPRVTRAEQSGSSVRVSATLSRQSSGKCTLSLRNGDVVVEKSADIVVGPSYYICNGFRIPVNELGSGRWVATVTHTLNNGRSASAEPKIIDVSL